MGLFSGLGTCFFLRESKYDSPNFNGRRGGLPNLESHDVHGENTKKNAGPGFGGTNSP
jgi:hypothetical protein